MRKCVHFVTIVLAVVTLAAVACAEPVSSLERKGFVNDFAGVLSPTTVAEIENISQQVLDKAHATIVVTTVKSTDGEPIFNYSVDLYQKWGVGEKGKDRGVLILLAIQDRTRSIRTGYGLEPILPDGKVGGFGREAVPYLQRGDYDDAVRLLVSRVADVIAKNAGVQIATSLPARSEPLRSPDQTELSPGKILAIIIVIIIVLAVPPLRRLLFYMFLFGGGGGGGYRGGGWGGGGGFGGGGGGFGGFGGGSTGGGGADGSW